MSQEIFGSANQNLVEEETMHASKYYLAQTWLEIYSRYKYHKGMR